MHVNLSWLKVEERSTSSLLVFVRGVDKLNVPNCLFELLAHSSDTHAYPTRHATRGLFTVPKSRTDYGRRTVLRRAITTWNSIPHQVTHASSRIRFKKQVKIHLMEQRGMWRDTHKGTDTRIGILLYSGIKDFVLYICSTVMLYDVLFYLYNYM